MSARSPDTQQLQLNVTDRSTVPKISEAVPDISTIQSNILPTSTIQDFTSKYKGNNSYSPKQHYLTSGLSGQNDTETAAMSAVSVPNISLLYARSPVIYLRTVQQ